MPDKVKELRDSAARELATARRSESAEDKSIHKRRAEALKSLAETEAWLDGRPERGQKPNKK